MHSHRPGRHPTWQRLLGTFLPRTWPSARRHRSIGKLYRKRYLPNIFLINKKWQVFAPQHLHRSLTDSHRLSQNGIIQAAFPVRNVGCGQTRLRAHFCARILYGWQRDGGYRPGKNSEGSWQLLMATGVPIGQFCGRRHWFGLHFSLTLKSIGRILQKIQTVFLHLPLLSDHHQRGLTLQLSPIHPQPLIIRRPRHPLRQLSLILHLPKQP
jgi:hypothetical protein